MKRPRTTRRAAVLARIAMVMLAGCAQPTTPGQAPSPWDGRIDLTTATNMVRAHISQQGASSASVPSLQELTTDDVFERMGLQVFIDTSGCTSYIIKKGSVLELCEGFGGYGLQSMCVADLDDNHGPEFVFSYSWGSGVHRSLVGICHDDGTSPKIAVTPFCYYGDLFVRREDDQHVAVEVGDYAWTLDGRQICFGEYTYIADFGEVRIEERGGTLLCRVVESGTLPDELRELIDPLQFVNTLSADGEYIPLAPTIHMAQDCLFDDYDMGTLPDPANHGTSWLGNVTLSRDLTYSFEGSSSNLHRQTGQDANFFMLHPTGTFKIQYAPGVDGQTHLEALEDGRRVATVVLDSTDGRARAAFDLILMVDDNWMGLSFASDEPLPFRMCGGEDDFMR